jgi:hypothetical protein
MSQDGDRTLFSLAHITSEEKVMTATKLMACFTNAEYADMHSVYGFCNGNTAVASKEYQRWCPDRWEKGAFMLSAHVGRGKRSLLNDKEIFDHAHDDPSTSAHSIAYETGLSQSAVWLTLHNRKKQ